MSIENKEVQIISVEYKNSFTDFGKKVKVKLVELNKTQNWLIEQLKKETGMFVDCSLLNKILTGRIHSERIVSAIVKLLGIQPTDIRKRM